MVIRDQSSQPRFGYWEHKKGGKYELLGFAVREIDLVPVVMYQRVDENEPIFVRPYVEFFDGRFVKCPESN